METIKLFFITFLFTFFSYQLASTQAVGLEKNVEHAQHSVPQTESSEEQMGLEYEVSEKIHKLVYVQSKFDSLLKNTLKQTDLFFPSHWNPRGDFSEPPYEPPSYLA